MLRFVKVINDAKVRNSVQEKLSVIQVAINVYGDFQVV